MMDGGDRYIEENLRIEVGRLHDEVIELNKQLKELKSEIFHHGEALCIEVEAHTNTKDKLLIMRNALEIAKLGWDPCDCGECTRCEIDSALL
jgi:hypothetical protein